MITVDNALAHLFALATPLETQTVPLINAAGRVLAHDVRALRDQPPFAASAMDGYALIGAEADQHAQFKIIGESAAGHGFVGALKPGHTVRIFTGAPIPLGATRVVIQEEVDRAGTVITITEPQTGSDNIRPAGVDFRRDDVFTAPRRLGPSDIALLAAMNIANVPVIRRPTVAIISTGDELVMPGETPGPDQIIASNTFGLKAMLDGIGADARLLPIARDNIDSLQTAFKLARGSDVIVTIGGASVGDHDLVGAVAADLGLERAFYKIAMRPGKPLMAGRINGSIMVGLPGNPVSAMVCGHVFLAPLIDALLGLRHRRTTTHSAHLTLPIAANGAREHYMRAVVKDGKITTFDQQDSSLLGVLSQANALLINPANGPACASGDRVDYIPI